MVHEEAIDLTLASLRAYWPNHQHVAVAWSGGKDSTATLTLLIHLIDAGHLPQPECLHVFYADTRQELPPIQIAADLVMRKLRERNWIEVTVVTAPLDKRFMVYILGRGVPPPNNNTLRWCTRQIKVEPMAEALGAAIAALPGTALMITGVREGESAVRDGRIAMSCSKDGAECGQGWYQQVLPDAKGIRGRIATLAPILHWRVCTVWDWLRRSIRPMRRSSTNIGWQLMPTMPPDSRQPRACVSQRSIVRSSPARDTRANLAPSGWPSI